MQKDLRKTNNMAFIKSKNLILRGIQPSDVDGPYFSWMNDFEITRYLESRFFPHTKEEMLQFLRETANGRNLMLAICKKDDGKHIGNIKIGPIDFIHRRAEMGLLIGDKEEWGKGYASEAIQALANFGFNELNLFKIWAGAYIENIGSIKAFEKAGFKKEAELKNHFFSQGRWTHSAVLSKFQG